MAIEDAADEGTGESELRDTAGGNLTASIAEGLRASIARIEASSADEPDPS